MKISAKKKMRIRVAPFWAALILSCLALLFSPLPCGAPLSDILRAESVHPEAEAEDEAWPEPALPDDADSAAAPEILPQEGTPPLPTEGAPPSGEAPPHPEEASVSFRWPRLDEIGASSYIVADGDSGEIIFELNGDGVAYPASMTKILTALTVIEAEDFDPAKPVCFSERACAMPAPESAVAGFLPGEVCPTVSCLYAMMVRSANEVANALAETYGGSIENFVAMMNAKAVEIGCENTVFVDPCGFGYVDHYTSGRDMVKIIRRAMQHDLFQKLVATKVYSLPPTNLHPMSGWSNLFNSNYLLVFQDSGYQSPWLQSIDGVKTGNTDLAGDCLAAAATSWDGRHIISVIFNGYFIGQSSSFVGPAIMSHTLLEEGAMRLGCPPRNDEIKDRSYGWPTLRSEAVETTAAEATEAIPVPSYTLIAAGQTEAATEDASCVQIKRWHLALLILCMTLFLISTLLLFYAALLRRQRRRGILP